jgi:serine/threonine-protein kinase
VQTLIESPWLRYGLAEGALVADKYRLKGILGEGGMGLVVSAHHEALDRMVALKVLRKESAKDPVMVERFLREARAAANLRSEHVAHVLDVGTLSTGAPFMVLEYLEGADLSQVLALQGRLPVAVACNYLVQACEAVAEAHAGGIVHRDLKPENLYLTTSLGGADCVKVLDFGVSKVLGAERAALTTTGVAVGSPVYMAPEQVRGSREIGPRADVWALGVVLYELLTGSLPFEAESLPDLCLKIANEAPQPLPSRRGDVPAALAAVVSRCLEKDPVRRYFDAAELAESLAPFAHTLVRSIASGPRLPSLPDVDPTAVTQSRPTALPVRRRRRALSWVGGAALAAGAAGAWLSHRPSGASEVALAAVDAALSVSVFAQPAARLEPEMTSPPALAAVTPSPPSRASAGVPASPPSPPRTAATTSGRPTHIAVPPTPRLEAPADDIPAFR